METFSANELLRDEQDGKVAEKELKRCGVREIPLALFLHQTGREREREVGRVGINGRMNSHITNSHISRKNSRPGL